MSASRGEAKNSRLKRNKTGSRSVSDDRTSLTKGESPSPRVVRNLESDFPELISRPLIPLNGTRVVVGKSADEDGRKKNEPGEREREREREREGGREEEQFGGTLNRREFIK